MIILSKCNLDGKNQQLVDRSSSIYHLSPVLDEHGVLRVDGRIRNAPKVELDCKYPIILPKNHHVTYLLVDDYHKRFHHGNNETIVNEIRQRFHIPSIRGFVKDVVKKCQYCKVSKARPVVPRMGPLPLARLSAGVRPFAYVGVDYFGPLQVKVGRATVKRWVALFTCLTIRAVHLEVIYSLTTEACIMGIRRFIGRRGSPVEFHSDNGTNFQGAERLLREQINMGLEFTFTNTNTKWLFIPPGAPHMGGSWERMVRSIKVAISDAYNENLDDERLLTLLIEAESIVNCRPLTYLPLDSAEQEALTPNHLLLGNSTGVHQPEQHAVCDRKLLSRSWDTLQKQIGSFWKRWTLEYLPTLTKRTKWFGETKNIEKGELVIIVEGSRRNNWARGRVLEVVSSPDGRVRQAIVQLASGTICRRPVSRLAVLEVQDGSGTGFGFHRGEDVAARATESQNEAVTVTGELSSAKLTDSKTGTSKGRM